MLIGNYTCPRSINEKSHLCLLLLYKHFAKRLLLYYKHFVKHACDFSLILLGRVISHNNHDKYSININLERFSRH